MGERYTSDPIELPKAGPGAVSRADLVFYGVDHSSSSFIARIFLDKPDADATTPIDDHSYAGSFTIFGHGGARHPLRTRTHGTWPDQSLAA